jgi:acyl homoserine lactone synthase
METFMLQLITPKSYSDFADVLVDMHRLRYRVFKQRLEWAVEVTDDQEADRYDTLNPTYLVQCNRDGRACGCVRFLPTVGPNMLRDVFPQLLQGVKMPECEFVWECSRFALDLDEPSPSGPGGISIATYELFAGMVEFALSQGMKEIVTVTDVRLERLSRRASWGLRRIAPPMRIGETMAVAGYLDVSRPALARLKECGGFSGPVLWAPVVPPKAA